MSFDSSENELANAVLAPDFMSLNGAVKDHLFHQSYGPLNEVLRRKSAKTIAMEREGKPEPCLGCPLVKGRRWPISRETATRALERPQRVCVDLRESKGVHNPGGRSYCMLIQCDFSGGFGVYFARLKSKTTKCFKQIIGNVRADRIPSIAECERSDSDGEFEDFCGDQCRERCIKQEFTPSDSPSTTG